MPRKSKIEDLDIILDTIDSFTHFYDVDGNKISSYCMFKALQDNFGLSSKELTDIAKEYGYKVFKIPAVGDMEGGLAIADKGCTEESIASDISSFAETEEKVVVKEMGSKEEGLTTKTGYEQKLGEKIEKQPNVEYKGFTIEHSPMGLVVDFTPDNLNKEHEMEIDGWFIHSPYYLQSNPNKDRIYLPLFCEDEYGHVLNFETLEQAKKYIDDWMASKKGRIKLKGWKKDECHFEILPEYRKEKKEVDEKLNGWSNEFINEEDVEEGDEYKITKCDVVTHYYLDHGKKPDKVEHDKYRVYFRRYKQLSNGGNYLDKNNWYEYGEGGYWFDSYEKARQAVEKYGKKLKESKEKIRWTYRGPLYRFNGIYSDEWEGYTEATSKKEAVRNLNSKAKKEFGFTSDSKLRVNPDLVEVSEKHPNDDDEGRDIKNCEKCGTRLNDAGECPVCDLGDESVLKEELIELEYENLPILTFKLSSPAKLYPVDDSHPDEYDEVETEVNYTYKVSHEDIEEALYYILVDTTDKDTEELEKYVSENFDELFDKYYKEVLEYFKDAAVSEAEENFEEPEKEIDEDIEKHDELNPKLFEGNKLKPEIREAVQKVADAFVDDLKEDEIKIKVIDVILVGSNVSYNYTKDSDLDIHVIADSSALECPKELVDKLYSAYRSIFNKNYEITIKGIPAEIYVELDNLGAAKSNGIYSVTKDEWIKEPVQTDIPDLDQEAFDKLFSEWEDRYNKLISSHEEPKEPEFIDTLEESKTIDGNDEEWDYYEIYCENEAQDNFSTCIKVHHGSKVPTEEEVEEFFRENYPEVLGEYHVEGVWDTINDFDDMEISLGDFDHIYPYMEVVLASNEGELKESFYDDIDKFITDIYDLRKTGIAKEGEHSLSNLVFKEFRNRGWLDYLKDLKKTERAKELSLEGLREDESGDLFPIGTKVYWCRGKVDPKYTGKVGTIKEILTPNKLYGVLFEEPFGVVDLGVGDICRADKKESLEEDKETTIKSKHAGGEITFSTKVTNEKELKKPEVKSQLDKDGVIIKWKDKVDEILKNNNLGGSTIRDGIGRYGGVEEPSKTLIIMGSPYNKPYDKGEKASAEVTNKLLKKVAREIRDALYQDEVIVRYYHKPLFKKGNIVYLDKEEETDKNMYEINI